MKKTILLFLFMVLAFAAEGYGGPARRGFFTRTQPDGTEIRLQLVGDEFAHAYATPDGKLMRKDDDGFYRALTKVEEDAFDAARGVCQSNKARAGRQTVASYRMNDFPTRGNVHGVVLLVAFADVAFSADSASTHDLLAARYNGDHYTEDFEYSFYSPTYKDTLHVGGTISGSARDYFRDQSLGLFTPTFDVLGPITLDNNRIYYGANERNGKDVNAPGMVKDACRKAYEMGLTDFSSYDNDGDGYVDYVYVVYAGNDEAQFGPKESIWAHAWTLSSPLVLGNMRISRYACSGELLIDSQDVPAGIGTFVHEFSHVIGLPDFYNTALGSNEEDFCLDYWSVMDYGLYCLEGYNPAGYTSFERYSMGWIPARDLRQPETVTLLPTDEEPVMYRAFVNDDDTTSYFVFENVQRTGWRANLPSYGLMISGVNYNASAWAGNTVNTDKRHHRHHIVPANNDYSFNEEQNQLYGKSNFEFTPESTPASISQFGDTLRMAVTAISRTKNGPCTFDFGGGNGLVPLPSGADDNGTAVELYRLSDHISIVRQGGSVRKVFVR